VVLFTRVRVNRGLIFVTANPVQGCSTAQHDDVINMHSQSHLIFFVIKPLLQRSLDKYHEIEEY
jgi:hypothetical protein